MCACRNGCFALYFVLLAPVSLRDYVKMLWCVISSWVVLFDFFTYNAKTLLELIDCTFLSRRSISTRSLPCSAFIYSSIHQLADGFFLMGVTLCCQSEVSRSDANTAVDSGGSSSGTERSSARLRDLRGRSQWSAALVINPLNAAAGGTTNSPAAAARNGSKPLGLALTVASAVPSVAPPRNTTAHQRDAQLSCDDTHHHNVVAVDTRSSSRSASRQQQQADRSTLSSYESQKPNKPLSLTTEGAPAFTLPKSQREKQPMPSATPREQEISFGEEGTAEARSGGVPTSQPNVAVSRESTLVSDASFRPFDALQMPALRNYVAPHNNRRIAASSSAGDMSGRFSLKSGAAGGGDSSSWWGEGHTNATSVISNPNESSRFRGEAMPFGLLPFGAGSDRASSPPRSQQHPNVVVVKRQPAQVKRVEGDEYDWSSLSGFAEPVRQKTSDESAHHSSGTNPDRPGEKEDDGGSTTDATSSIKGLLRHQRANTNASLLSGDVFAQQRCDGDDGGWDSSIGSAAGQQLLSVTNGEEGLWGITGQNKNSTALRVMKMPVFTNTASRMS